MGLGQLHRSQTPESPPQKVGTVLVSEDKFIISLPHCSLKARNTVSVLALLVLVLAFKEARIVPAGLLGYTTVHT